MKKVLILSIVLIFALSMQSCIIIYNTGAKIYNVSATTEEGGDFIKKYNVKYIAKSFGLFYTDILRWDGKFAIDVVKESGKIKYNSIKKDYVENLGLVPSFNWWERNGKWVSLFLLVGIFVYFFFDDLYMKYKKKKMVKLNRASINFLLSVAWSDGKVKPQELNLISYFTSKGNFGLKVDSEYIKKVKKEPILWDKLKKNSNTEKLNLYKTAFLTAISDGELSKEEADLLKEYINKMEISQTDVKNIQEKVIEDIRKKK